VANSHIDGLHYWLPIDLIYALSEERALAHLHFQVGGSYGIVQEDKMDRLTAIWLRTTRELGENE